MVINLAVAGAAGRMGRRIIALASGDPAFRVTAALEQAACPDLNADAFQLAGMAAGGVPVRSAAQAPFDVLIDFSAPEGTLCWLNAAREARRPIVIGTTGHDSEALHLIRRASESIPVLHAPNMSVGVNVFLRVAQELGATLDPSYDVEITEAHHRFKADAPSGTALALRDAVIAGRARSGHPTSDVVCGREGQGGPRPAGQVGMHSLRLGDTIGEHTVYFGSLGETVTIGHIAHSRDTFAAGALRAARWLVSRAPGLYSMQDVLFGPPAAHSMGR